MASEAKAPWLNNYDAESRALGAPDRYARRTAEEIRGGLMYQSFERPTINASIPYYDYKYDCETSRGVLEALERNGLFPPAKICLDKLTRGRSVNYKPIMREQFVEAYKKKDLSVFSWDTDDPNKAEDYCSFRWALTFYKNSKLMVKNPVFKPWNVFMINATYGWMKVTENYNSFMNLVKDLIPILSPICIDIDDTANANHLLHAANEPHFKPDYIQQVYWGNYWGEHLKEQVDLTKLRDLPVPQLEETEHGVFFTLSDSVFDFDSKTCKKLRKKICAKVIRK